MPRQRKKKKVCEQTKGRRPRKKDLLYPSFTLSLFLYSSMSHNDNINGLNQQFGKLPLFSLTQTTHSPWSIPPATKNQQTTPNSQLLFAIICHINENGPSPKRDHFFVFLFIIVCLLAQTLSGLNQLQTLRRQISQLLLHSHQRLNQSSTCRMRAGNMV